MGKSHLTNGEISGLLPRVRVLARGVIYIHSAPRALCPHVEWAVGRALGRAVNFDWRDQPVLDGRPAHRVLLGGPPRHGRRARLRAARLGAPALRGHRGCRPRHRRRPLDAHARSRHLLRPDRHRPATSSSPRTASASRWRSAGSDAFELHRELRLALGQAWDDELEPFRHASEDSPVVWLHKVG